MVLLHIASIDNNNSSGVAKVVPIHISKQSATQDVAFFNIKNVPINGVDNQVFFANHSAFDINKMKPPFNHPDLVIFHEVFYFKYISIYKNLLKNKIKYIIFPHGCLTKLALRKKRIKKALGRFIYFNRFIKCSNGIQYLSLFEKKQTSIKKTSFIGTNGIISSSINCSSAFYKERTAAKCITFIGRLDVYHKGLDILLKAIGLIKNEIVKNKFSFTLYGPFDGTHEKEIRKMILKFGIFDIVSLNDAIYGEEKKNTIKKSMFFIQTSRFEGMPVGILEAMSFCVPVIVTDGTCLKELVNQYNAGFGVELECQIIASAILSAINCDEEQYLQKCEGAIKMINKEFNWDRITKETLFQYERIIND